MATDPVRPGPQPVHPHERGRDDPGDIAGVTLDENLVDAGGTGTVAATNVYARSARRLAARPPPRLTGDGRLKRSLRRDYVVVGYLHPQGVGARNTRRRGVTTVHAMKIGVQLPEVEWEVPFPELIGMAQLAEGVGVRFALARRSSVVRPACRHAGTMGGVDVARRTRRVDDDDRTRPAGGVHVVPCAGDARQNRGHRRRGLGWPADRRARRRLEHAGLSGVRVPVRQSGGPLRGGVHDHPHAARRTGPSTSTGRTTTPTDCVLHPRSPRQGGPPLMVGSIGDRMLDITLPHVVGVEHVVEPVRQLGRRIRAGQGAGRRTDRRRRPAPDDVEATAAVYFRLPGGVRRQMGDYDTDVPTDPIEGSTADFAARLGGLADAGCAHVQIVVDPITRDTIERTRRRAHRVPSPLTGHRSPESVTSSLRPPSRFPTPTTDRSPAVVPGPASDRADEVGQAVDVEHDDATTARLEDDRRGGTHRSPPRFDAPVSADPVGEVGLGDRQLDFRRGNRAAPSPRRVRGSCGPCARPRSRWSRADRPAVAAADLPRS